MTKSIFEGIKREKNIFVLISSVLLLVIPFYYLNYFISNESKQHILRIISILIIFQGSLSILADYFFLENKKIAVLDRFMAFILTIYLFYHAVKSNTNVSIGLVIITVLFYIYSRKSKNTEEWNYRHCIWHLSNIVIISVAIGIIGNNN